MDYQDEKINLVINKLTKEQYDNAVLSGLIDDKQLYLVTDDRPIEGDARYNLSYVQPALSNIVISAGYNISALTFHAEDLTITTAQISNDIYPVAVYMPQIPETGARDFCVRIECLSSAPSCLMFLGSNSESCDFESSDDDWLKLETGANLFNFTETKRLV